MIRPRVNVALPPAVLAKLSALQGALNAKIDPNWLANRSCDDWCLTVTLEAAEAIESYPYKWWKNVKAAPNIDNVKIELVDILHFSLSGTMQMLHAAAGASAHGAASAAAAASTAEQIKQWGLNPHIVTPLTDTKSAVATFKNMMYLAKFHKFDTITEHVIAAADDLGFNVVSYYIAKHTLNVIRQLGGYKDGTYVKVNQGKEDNELLHEVIAGLQLEQCIGDEHEAVWDKIMDGVYTTFQVPADQRKATKAWIA